MSLTSGRGWWLVVGILGAVLLAGFAVVMVGNTLLQLTGATVAGGAAGTAPALQKVLSETDFEAPAEEESALDSMAAMAEVLDKAETVSIPHPSGWTAQEIDDMRNSPDAQFDIVYLWVNGSDPAYLKARNRFRGGAGADDRDRDNGEFRLGLRSIDMYMPWWNGTLFLVHQNLPCWLNLSHPRLRLMHHKQFFLWQAQTLPTFNSDAIDGFLHLVPGISQRFALFNDDFFIGRPVKPQEFIDGGKMRFWYEPQKPRSVGSGMFLHKIDRTYQLAKDKWPDHPNLPPKRITKHCPWVVDKDILATTWTLFPKMWEKTVKARFRIADSIDMPSLHDATCRVLRPDLCTIVPEEESEREALLFRIGNMGPYEIMRFTSRLWFQPPAFFTLNDQQLDSDRHWKDIANEASFVYRVVLPRLYPTPSSWETHACGGVRIRPLDFLNNNV